MSRRSSNLATMNSSSASSPTGAPSRTRSSPIVINRRLHPLDRVLVNVSVTGSGNRFDISITPVIPAIPVVSRVEVSAVFNDPFNTTEVTPLSSGDTGLSGLAAGPGEVYVDLAFSRSDGETERRRIAIVIEEDGTAREMRYEETASWVHNAVVYEIFPFSFGPEAFGAPANPGRRLRDITRELDYIAQMGFNTIWFMPIMHNQAMNQISGGYNIIDFYTVDPRLGTNSDFKALVERAHELGIRVILDITPSHVSPAHPWVASLRNGGPYGAYLQTEPAPTISGSTTGAPISPKSGRQGPIITNTRDSGTWRISTGTTTICKPKCSTCWRSG